MGTVTKLKPVSVPKAQKAPKPKSKPYSFKKVVLPPPPALAPSNKKPKINKLPKTKKEAKTGLFEKKAPDPVIAMLQTVIQESGLDATAIVIKTQNIAWTTVNNIIVGTTRRPTNFTCDLILRACGKRRVIENLA